MSTHALGIDANWDPTTKAAFDYRELNVYPHLAAHGITVTKRQGIYALHSAVGIKAVEPSVIFMTGEGHGTATAFLGHNNAAVFEVGSYANAEADGKIAHFLSCDTVQTLGPDFIAKGCLAYFGYDAEVYYIPAEQAVFFACDSEIDLALAEGKTAKESLDRVKELVAKYVEIYDAVGADTEIEWLLNTFGRLVLLGDPNATLS